MKPSVSPPGGPADVLHVDPRLTAALTGRYRIERELGRGGMATVYLARDLRHQRDVALKVMHPELALGRERFLREIGVAAGLTHPHIVALHDSGDADGLLYYLMPYVDGRTLRDRLASGPPFGIDEVLRVSRQIADALGSAHEHGVVHRDVKPENILISSGGHAFVTDFGVAKAADLARDERLTRTGVAVGTPAYMSPEQLYAGDVDARSDVWALGCVMFEMLTGRMIGRSATTDAGSADRVTAELRRLRPDTPDDLAQVVQRALSAKPEQRFPSAREMAQALGPDTSRTRGTARPVHRTRNLALTALVVLVPLVAWLAFRPQPTRQSPRDPQVIALYEQGVREYNRRTPDGSINAIQSFTAALERDSTYAPAWVGLSNTYSRAIIRRWTYPGVLNDSILRLAVAASHRALALDSSDSRAWVARAEVSRMVDPTAQGPALRAARRAVALDSTNGQAWFVLGMINADSGDVDSAIDAWRHSVRHNPSYNQGLAFLALGHFWRRQYDSAAFWADSAVTVDPSYHLARHTVGLIEAERGNFARARAAMEAARRVTSEAEVPVALAGRAMVEARSGNRQRAFATMRIADSLARTYFPTPIHIAVYVSQGYASLGDPGRAMDWLRRYPVRDDRHFLTHLQCEPAFAPLANDTAFIALVNTPGRGPRC